MWQEFEAAKRAMFRLCNGKEVCLWGYGYSGRFCEHLFRRGNRTIKYILDDSKTIDCKLDIERSFLLQELSPDTHVVLCAFPREEKAVAFLTQLGYVEGENFIFIRELFYGDKDVSKKLSYYDWLEYRYGLDITAYRMWNQVEMPNADSTYYSPGIDYSLVDVLNYFEFDSEDAVFDFGCGKGGPLLLFYFSGVGRIGGVEYDPDLYRIALANIKKMNLDSSGIINRDAAEIITQLDSYNYFFMYNPFMGKTFGDVVRNLEESFQRKRRKMYIIYSGPYCHEMLVRNGVFKFSKVIKTDYAVRNVRIYCTN